MKNFIDEFNEGLAREHEFYKEKGDDYLLSYPDWFYEFGRLRDERNHLLAGIHYECKPTRLKPHEHYEKMWSKEDFDITDYQYDCARSSVTYGDRRVEASYTSWGIKLIDTAFCKAIQRYGQGDTSFTYKELENMILTQPHLHELIKANLIYCLKQVKQ